MSYPFRFALRIFSLVVFAALAASGVKNAGAQEKKLKELQWSHAFDLATRKLGDTEFTKDTKRWGVEAFRDNNTLGGVGLYVSETGSMALAPNFVGLNPPLNPSKGPALLTGNDLPARKAGVLKFDKDTQVHPMELFRDPNADNWLFITDKGNLAACNGKLFPGKTGKDPKWVHSVDLQVRKGGVKEWKDASKFGIEVYRDANTGNLIYITQQGFIAIVPEEKEVKADSKAPEWLHGLDLSCRASNEKSFTKDTRKFGVEVYHDVTTGNLIFISETGSIAVTPAAAGLAAPTVKAKEPEWTHGLNVKARRYGEKDFSDTTKAFGAEVFRDPNVGVFLYVNELGYITAIAAK
ncbi:MAG: hypothetical protein HYX68_06775 [Planctomycetes bacterium]|nr:hypothetical protein [Planctomycetota bacterium]